MLVECTVQNAKQVSQYSRDSSPVAVERKKILSSISRQKYN